MSAPPVPTADGVVTKPSPRSAPETVRRLTYLVLEKGLTVFALVDHSGEAAKAGLAMPDTKLLEFGSPVAGTPVMVAARLAALDLPLKVLVWANEDGAAFVSYNSPRYLATRYTLTDELSARLEAIDAITDAAVAPS